LIAKPNVLNFLEESAEPNNDLTGPVRIAEPFSNPWQTVSSTEVYRNPWIQVTEHRVIRPDGKPGIYGVVAFQNLAVGVLALNDEGFLVLVGQWRYPLGVYSWEIPEGGCPLGQDPLETAQRELREETGLVAHQWESMLRMHLSNSVSDEAAVVFMARSLRQGVAEPEGTEKLMVRWVRPVEAWDMICQGLITDAISVAAIQHLLLIYPELGTSAPTKL
jgi:8-oxo-dGTP pyrophosphatase MutT (NUDIX family)